MECYPSEYRFLDRLQSDNANYLLRKKARRMLASRSPFLLEKFFSHLFSDQDNHENTEAKKLLVFCYTQYPNGFPLKLCKEFESSRNLPRFRSRCLSLSRSVLDRFDQIRFKFNPIILNELKPVLVNCLRQEIPKSIFKILSRVVSLVANDIFRIKDGEWNDLRDFILFLIESDFRKAFRLLQDLTLNVDRDFIVPIFEKIYPKIVSHLDKQHGSMEDWVLGFGAAFNLAVQLGSTEKDIAGDLSYLMIKTMTKMVMEGMDGLVKSGLEAMADLVKQKVKRYLPAELDFVYDFIKRINVIAGMRSEMKDAARRVSKVLEEDSQQMDRFLRSQAKNLLATSDHTSMADLILHLILHQLDEEEGQERWDARRLYGYCIKHFPNCLSVKLCEVFESSDYNCEIRRQSISLLYALITQLNSNHTFLNSNAVLELKPILISCLFLPETPETDFKILSKVISNVSIDVFGSNNAEWNELCDYIITTLDLDFRKAFYVFHDLPMMLDSNFLMALLETIFPEILNRLDPRVGNAEEWVLAFEAGFCLGVHMVDSPRSDLVGNIKYALIKSANELVSEGMEEVLQRVLEDMVVMVKEEATRYYQRECLFVSDLVRKISEIMGCGEETINVAQKVSWVLTENQSAETVEPQNDQDDEWA